MKCSPKHGDKCYHFTLWYGWNPGNPLQVLFPGIQKKTKSDPTGPSCTLFLTGVAIHQRFLTRFRHYGKRHPTSWHCLAEALYETICDRDPYDGSWNNLRVVFHPLYPKLQTTRRPFLTAHVRSHIPEEVWSPIPVSKSHSTPIFPQARLLPDHSPQKKRKKKVSPKCAPFFWVVSTKEKTKTTYAFHGLCSPHTYQVEWNCHCDQIQWPISPTYFQDILELFHPCPNPGN